MRCAPAVQVAPRARVMFCFLTMVDAAGIALHGQRRDAGLRVRAEQCAVSRAEQPRRGDLQRGQPRVLRRGRPVTGGSTVSIWGFGRCVQWTAYHPTICIKHSHHILSWNTYHEHVPVVSVARAKRSYHNAPNIATRGQAPAARIIACTSSGII